MVCIHEPQRGEIRGKAQWLEHSRKYTSTPSLQCKAAPTFCKNPGATRFSNTWLAGIIKNKGQKPIIVNGVADHVHLFRGLKPAMAISDLIRDVKNNTSNFVNERKLVKGRFAWQEGSGAFSYGHSQINQVYNYILHQKERHRRKTFREEYLDFLQKFQIPYEDRFLFDWPG